MPSHLESWTVNVSSRITINMKPPGCNYSSFPSRRKARRIISLPWVGKGMGRDWERERDEPWRLPASRVSSPSYSCSRPFPFPWGRPPWRRWGWGSSITSCCASNGLAPSARVPTIAAPPMAAAGTPFCLRSPPFSSGLLSILFLLFVWSNSVRFGILSGILMYQELVLARFGLVLFDVIQ